MPDLHPIRIPAARPTGPANHAGQHAPNPHHPKPHQRVNRGTTMSMHQLPTADQPDNYTGIWNRHRVRYLYADTTTGLWHLCVGTPHEGSYCTHMNPMRCVDLAGVRLHYKGGGYVVVSRAGLPVGNLMPDSLARRHPITYEEQHLEVCPNCLSMAAVQAEMLGQRAYPLRRLLNELEGTNTPSR